MKEIVKKTKSGDAVGLYIYGVKLAFLWMWWIIKGIASTYQELERNKPQSGFYTYLIIFLIFWNYGAITLMYAAIMKPLPIEKIIVSTLIAISSMIALIFSTIKLCRL